MPAVNKDKTMVFIVAAAGAAPLPLPTPPPPMPAWFAALVFLGLWVLVMSTATFLAWLHRAFLRGRRKDADDDDDLARRFGTWAVVTGPTDRIGRAVALELARRGLSLILVGRNLDKLARVKDEVLDAAAAARPSTCEVRAVGFDLASGDKEMARGVACVAAAAAGDVGILVNNAGATYPCAAYFHEVPAAVWETVLQVNVEAATRIARAIMPGMVRRRRGAVVNVGSGCSVVLPSFPLYAVYAASKA